MRPRPARHRGSCRGDRCPAHRSTARRRGGAHLHTSQGAHRAGACCLAVEQRWPGDRSLWFIARGSQWLQWSGEKQCVCRRGVYLARLCAPLLAEGTLVWMRQATLMGHATRTQSTAAPASAAHTTASRSSRRPPVHMRLRCCRRSSRTFRQASGGSRSECRCSGQRTCLH